MNRSSLKLILPLVALCALLLAAPALAGAKTCVPKSSKHTLWHNRGVQVYTKGKGTDTYSCSDTFDKQLRIEKIAEFEGESFTLFRTNGRYLFYVRGFVGAVESASFNSGRVLDLKTGKSMRKVAQKTTVDANVSPQCADLCRRRILGAAIGPKRSFVVGYDVTLPFEEGTSTSPALPSDAPSRVIEMHCPSADLTHDRTVVLDKNVTQLDEFSPKADRGRVKWKHHGEWRSAKFC